MKYIFVVFAFCFLISCKKEENGQTKTEMISGSSWKYESGGVDQDKNGSIDLSFEALSLIPPCILDNTFTFNSNGSGTADEGTTKCNVALPQSSPFNWSFANNETAISITGSVLGLGGQLNIRELTGTKFTLSKDTTVNLGGLPLNVALVVNLKH